MGRWTLLILFLHLILHVSSNSAFTPRTVDVKGNVTLPCKGAISNVTWVTEKNILVAQYQQGELTVGDWFKDRVSISKVDFSLNISPVEYSDRGLYECHCMGKRLGDVKLEVLVPTKVRARLGEPATLPCYVPVDKTQKSNLDTAHWKKDGQTVLGFQSGLFSNSSGCENRCSMSVDKVRFGDLSLNISEVRHSDQGTYQCFSTEKTVRPDEIILTIEDPKTIFVTVPHTPDPPATAGNKLPWVLLVVVVVVMVVRFLGVKVNRCFRRTQRQPVSEHSSVSQEDSEHQRERASLVPGQPVEENGEEEQLRAPVCESGDTEDNLEMISKNSSHCEKVWALPTKNPTHEQ